MDEQEKGWIGNAEERRLAERLDAKAARGEGLTRHEAGVLGGAARAEGGE